jgi:aminoglycoside phosphotransferase (APT) family kinase protein
LARSLIERQFPALAPADVELLGAGWDNSAFRVNHTYVFRFPRRRFAVPFLETETRCLPALAARLPLPVPAPTFLGQPSPDYPWPFAGYPLIPGRTACAAALDDRERGRVAPSLAHFLAALHAIPVAQAEHFGADHDRIERLSLARHLPRARDNLQRLAHAGIIDGSKHLRAILDNAPEAYSPRTDTLVHGDFYVRHLLVNAQNQLAGVIDWGDVHWGDPASDLMIAHSFLPPAAHAAFRATYGPIDEVTWQIARLRALWHTLYVLTYAADVGDADLMREGRLALTYFDRS